MSIKEILNGYDAEKVAELEVIWGEEFKSAIEIVHSHSVNMMTAADALEIPVSMVGVQLARRGLEIMLADCYVSGVSEDETDKTVGKLVQCMYLTTRTAVYDRDNKKTSGTTKRDR